MFLTLGKSVEEIRDFAYAMRSGTGAMEGAGVPDLGALPLTRLQL